MQPKRLLMIGTDRKIFEEGSAVRARQAEYAKGWDEVHIIVFAKRGSKYERQNPKSEIRSSTRFAGASAGQEQIQDSKFKITSQDLSNENFPKSETVIAPNCWAYSTRSWSKFLYPFDAISLGRFLIEKRGITEITCQDASLTAMAGISLKKQFGIPLEIQVHEDLGSPNFGFTIINKIRKAMALSYLPKADHIRVVSGKIKDYLIGSLEIDSAKITVRPIPVDLERVRNAPVLVGADLHKKYPQFEKIVLMVGRLEKEKNFGLAIKAWAEVVKAVPKAGLVIVGSGSEEGQLKKLAKNLGLFDGGGGHGGVNNRVQSCNYDEACFDCKSSNISDNLTKSNSIIFENWADQETLFSYYKTSDQFLVTSLFEGYGMALVEAKAAGCDIISTDVGVAREVGAKIVGWEVGEVVMGIVEGLKV